VNGLCIAVSYVNAYQTLNDSTNEVLSPGRSIESNRIESIESISLNPKRCIRALIFLARTTIQKYYRSTTVQYYCYKVSICHKLQLRYSSPTIVHRGAPEATAMDFYGSDRSPEEEDDDDIVVIQDQKYYHHRSLNDSIHGEDRGGIFSPSQRPESQHEYSRRNVRRRQQQQESIIASTVAVLAASQEEARHLFFGHGEEKKSDPLNQSNAFASLESLLNQDHIYMSMTQEKEGDDDDDEGASDELGEEEQKQENLDNEMQQKEVPFELDDQSRVKDSATDFSGYDESKGKALDFIHLSADASRSSALEKLKATKDSFYEAAMTSTTSLRARARLLSRSEPSCPARLDSYKESIEPMEDDNDEDRQKTLHDLDRELQRQRQRRKSPTKSNPKQTSNYLPRMPNVQPSRAMRQHLQKDWQSKKTGRSNSADKIRISRPSKRRARRRSASPNTRERVVTPKSHAVEEANRSLVGSR
jgi:hypothetical protein